MTNNQLEVVTISYDDLFSAYRSDDGNVNIDALIEQAFGSSSPNSLGIVAITDIPKLPTLRLKLLPLARKMANLKADQLDEITVPESLYQVGWSHGREKLEGDKLDLGKGSFYFNPLTDDLVESMLARRHKQNDIDNNSTNTIIDGDTIDLLKWDESLNIIRDDDELKTLAKSNPGFFAPNVWPTNSMPELEATVKEVGQLVHEVGKMIAKCCDSYVAARCPGYEPKKLERILLHSKCCKARLLHYFATDDAASNVDDNTNDADDTQFSNWCGWHNDHGSLTGLLPALYIDGQGEIVECPDPQAGLYIKSRTGALVHARLPENSLAFQVGETMQVHTGGWLQATPHAVRGCKGGHVTRETFAVFMEPEYHISMNLPKGRAVEDTQCIEAERWLPSTVRTLRSRWQLGMNFGEFSDATFAAFH